MRRIVSVIVTVLGLVAIALAVCSATIWKPSSTVEAKVAHTPSQPYLVTEPSVLAAVNPEVTVTATAPDDAKVTVIVANASNVEAWLANDPYVSVTGVNTGSGTLEVDEVTESCGQEASSGDAAEQQEGQEAAAQGAQEAEESAGSDCVPREASGKTPVGSDLWNEEHTDTSTVTFSQSVTSDQTVILAVTDGQAAAPTLTLSWEREVPTPWYFYVGLVAGGLMVLVGVFLFLIDVQVRHADSQRRARAAERAARIATADSVATAGLPQLDDPNRKLTRREQREKERAEAAGQEWIDPRTGRAQADASAGAGAPGTSQAERDVQGAPWMGDGQDPQVGQPGQPEQPWQGDGSWQGGAPWGAPGAGDQAEVPWGAPGAGDQMDATTLAGVYGDAGAASPAAPEGAQTVVLGPGAVLGETAEDGVEGPARGSGVVPGLPEAATQAYRAARDMEQEGQEPFSVVREGPQVSGGGDVPSSFQGESPVPDGSGQSRAPGLPGASGTFVSPGAPGDAGEVGLAPSWGGGWREGGAAQPGAVPGAELPTMGPGAPVPGDPGAAGHQESHQVWLPGGPQAAGGPGGPGGAGAPGQVGLSASEDPAVGFTPEPGTWSQWDQARTAAQGAGAVEGPGGPGLPEPSPDQQAGWGPEPQAGPGPVPYGSAPQAPDQLQAQAPSQAVPGSAPGWQAPAQAGGPGGTVGAVRAARAALPPMADLGSQEDPAVAAQVAAVQAEPVAPSSSGAAPNHEEHA